jgi:hypothetical protein
MMRPQVLEFPTLTVKYQVVGMNNDKEKKSDLYYFTIKVSVVNRQGYDLGGYAMTNEVGKKCVTGMLIDYCGLFKRVHNWARYGGIRVINPLFKYNFVKQEDF